MDFSEICEKLNFSIREFEEFFRNTDLKNGANPKIFKNHSLTYGNMCLYVENKLVENNELYREIFNDYHNFIFFDDSDESFEEHKKISSRYNAAKPEKFIKKLMFEFRVLRNSGNSLTVSNSSVLRSVVKKDSTHSGTVYPVAKNVNISYKLEDDEIEPDW